MAPNVTNQQNGSGQFTLPERVAVDSGGNVFVSVAQAHRIQKFKADGSFITQWGSFGSDNGKFNGPNGLAIKSGTITFLEERVFVADTLNHRIQVFRPELTSEPT